MHEILITFVSKMPLIFNKSVCSFAEPARPSIITFYVVKILYFLGLHLSLMVPFHHLGLFILLESGFSS